MKIWLDTEFVDDGHTIDLISIGMVREDGRELYLQSADFVPHVASQWVKDNVIAHLKMCPYTSSSGISRQLRDHKHGKCVPTMNEPERWQCPWRTHLQICHEVQAFVGNEKPVFIGWCSAYDWVALCQLFGTMMDIPSHWPHYIRDVQYLMDICGLSDNDIPQQQGTAHNALEDARHIRDIYQFITQPPQKEE
jgi:3'-5' exoribonuclease-like protein